MMRRGAGLASVLSIVVLPTIACADPLFYGGDLATGDVLRNEDSSGSDYAFVYDDFNVTGATWSISSLFSNDVVTGTMPTRMHYEIRAGVSSGVAGTRLFAGDGVPSAITATGRRAFSRAEYTFRMDLQSAFILTPGHYWLAVAPLVGASLTDANGIYISPAKGSAGVGSPLANGQAFYRATAALTGGPYNYAPVSAVTSTATDFSMGVLGGEDNGGTWLNVSSAGNTWSTGSNWSGSAAPTSGSNVRFDPSATYAVNVNVAAQARNVIAGGGVVTLNMTGKSLTVANECYANGIAGAVLAVKGGTLQATNRLYAGDTAGYSGDILLDGTIASSVEVTSGWYGSGAITLMNNASLAATNEVALGRRASGRGTITLNSGATLTTPSLMVGGGYGVSGGGGTLNINTAATVDVSGTATVLNDASVIKLAGGTLKVATLNLGGNTNRLNWTSGELTLTGGAMNGLGAPLVVPSQGGLRGSGTINGSVTNAGGIAAQAISITGNLITTGNISELVTSPSDFAKLTVSGNVTVGGSLTLFQNPGFDLTTQRLDVIKGASVAGRFSSVVGQRQLSPTRWLAVFYRPTSVSIAVAPVGDVSLDGAVNFDDLVTIAQNYQATNTTIDWTAGDLNNSHTVDFDDLVLLAQNYGVNLASDGLAGASAAQFAIDWTLARALAPEPALLATMMSGAAFIAARRRGGDGRRFS